MSHPVLSLAASTRLGDAAVYFRTTGIRHCLVVDDQDRSLGILTQTDLVMSQGAEFFLQMKSIESVKVSIPVVVSHDLSVSEAMHLLRTQRLTAIIVKYPESAHGILTERDIVRLVASGTLLGTVG